MIRTPFAVSGSRGQFSDKGRVRSRMCRFRLLSCRYGRLSCAVSVGHYVATCTFACFSLLTGKNKNERKQLHLICEGDGINQQDICFDDDFLCYIAPKRKASLFKAAYRDVAELIQELREKLTKQGVDLRGFPLETCVCSLSGTYFC